ncbi:MAG TPA: ParA family protein [Candidatus Hydrothermia bacterium]|nr:ParA family protein [Candidatus Hydrothermia bacterium]HOL24488.1 ParA family protein [Candidatus Hydrothermia bacterium]
MKVIVVTNQKGGVGKTTLAFHIAHALSEKKHRVLAIDMDPQGNLTYTFQAKVPENSFVYKLFEGKNPEPFRVSVEGDSHIDLIGSDIRLSRFETDTRFENFFRLKKFLHGKEYDYVIVDTPPSLGLFTANSLVAATHIVVPVDLSVYAALGLQDLLETIDKIGEYANTKPEFTGIVIMGQLGRTSLGQTVSSTLREQYGDLVIGEVSHSVKVREAVSLGRTIWKHAPGQKVAEEFREIIEKILGRVS